MLYSALLVLSPLSTGVPQQLPSDSGVREILDARVATGRNPGIVVGVLDDSGPRAIAAGTAGREGMPLHGRTVFEIGSATKVFTAILLADMAARGEARLDEPVDDLLPDTVETPQWEGHEITLADLATHTSGLPRLPSNLAPENPANPYDDYTVEQMYEFLSGYTLPRPIGEEWEYSNLGAGLLGHALALRAGKSFEELVRERILHPLGMKDTGIELPPDLRSRLARGHGTTGEPVPNWDLPTLAGAGALRSTVRDMLRFAAANLASDATALSPVLLSTHEIRAPAAGDFAMALGWVVNQKFDDRPIVWHNGGTGGYGSFVGLDKKNGRAIVVLTNGAYSVDDIGFHLLDTRHALADPEPLEKRVDSSVDPKLLPAYDSLHVRGTDSYHWLNRERLCQWFD